MSNRTHSFARAPWWRVSFMIAITGVVLGRSASAQTFESVLATFDAAGPTDHDHLPKLEDGPELIEPLVEPADPHVRTAFGGPSNQGCTGAFVIPGSTVNYATVQNTVSATNTVLCSPLASCGHPSGNSNQVFYRYTPDVDGYIDVNTYNSSYDTVLAIFDGCSSFFNCNPVNQLACSNNLVFGNITSEILGLPVQAGQTYYILVSDYNPTLGGGTLRLNLAWGPKNDFCNNATSISGVAFDPPLLSTHNAQSDLCEANESCEFNNVGVSNSVWYTYTPACDGTISMNTNGSNYDTVLSVFDGCGEWVNVDAPCIMPSEIDCDDDAGTGLASQIVDLPVAAGVPLLIKVSDYNTSTGGGYLDFNFVFSGATQPVAEITSPSGFDCVCNSVTVTGSANAGAGQYVDWVLDMQPGTGGLWSTVAAGTDGVSDGTLAVIDLAGLSQGYYLLRLSAKNACGETSTAVTVMFVDTQLDTFDIVSPQDQTVVGGDVCIGGTIWDHCFDAYTAGFTGGQSIPMPVDAANPIYAQSKINQTAAVWKTVTDGIDDGVYEVVVAANDECGHADEIAVRVTVDNTAPVTEIDDPVNCEIIAPGTVVAVIGSVADDNLSGWVLEYTGGPHNGWVTIATGSTAVSGALLGTWNTAGLPACSYTLRLRASDSAIINCNPAIAHHSEFTVSIKLGNDAPPNKLGAQSLNP